MKFLKNIFYNINQNINIRQITMILSKTSLLDKKEYNNLMFKMIKMIKQPEIQQDSKSENKEIIIDDLKEIEDGNSYRNLISNYEEYEKIMHRYLEIENDPKVKTFISKGSLEKDLNFELDVKLKDVLKGKKLKIEYLQFCKCTDCEMKIKTNKCKICNGTGKYEQNKSLVLCSTCKGYGTNTYKTDYCNVCSNELYYEKIKEIQFTIGKEFYAGIIYTYPNQGNYDPATDNYGHLKIKPNIISDYADDKTTFFKVSNESQIETEHSANISELALGGSMKIKHPTGECEIYINKCTQPDDYKVVNNVGIPIYYDNEEKQMRKGSMVVVFKLKLPNKEYVKNTEEYWKLFEDLQKFENLEELNQLNGLSGIKI